MTKTAAATVVVVLVLFLGATTVAAVATYARQPSERTLAFAPRGAPCLVSAAPAAHSWHTRREVADATAATPAGLARLSLTTLPTAEAAERWFLMSRHGDCAEVGVLKRRVPDLGNIGDPDAFASFMRQKGYEVKSSRISVPKGEAREVNVPQKELFLIFVTAEMCRNREAR